MTTRSEIEPRSRAIEEYRRSWPDRYPVVRELMDRGFWPDCYGGGPEPHGCQPPTKFGYPRAGVHAPHHVDGIGAGAEILVYAFGKGETPDELRDQPVWLICGHTISLPSYRIYQGASRTLDATVSTAVRYGEWAREHLIVPDWDPETRRPTLTVADWRRLATIRRGEAESPAPQQMELFTSDPADRSPTEAVRRCILRRLDRLNQPDEERVVLPGWAYLKYLLDDVNTVLADTAPPFEGAHP